MSCPAICFKGIGAVSPAGWGVAAMMDALLHETALPPVMLERPLGTGTVRTPVLRVPADAAASPKGARLRRASPITKFAAAAMLEALGTDRLQRVSAGELRVGVIFTLMNGCVNYSNRFFSEVLSDPAFASPILFPETVFNAPSSHLSAFIGSTAPNDTLITDGSGFISGIDLAAEWIGRGDVDGCIVVAAEEIDWLSSEALTHYSRKCLPSEGAAAVYLEPGDGDICLLEIPDPFSYAAMDRSSAAAETALHFSEKNDGKTLLSDGICGVSKIDAAESSAWKNWSGPRISPRKTLGEGLGVSTAWQTVAAVNSVLSEKADHAIISAVGGNQQAAAMRIGRRP